ncbi:uncharacterized protein LOC135462604 [Liolophura sinensis]|uniref:uncharacterized protein LOC135462604 n=1 Tax=Liolophura sinensis TaxID=3198878 RepID=UPI003159658A
MDCNDNAAQRRMHPASLVTLATESKKTWNGVSQANGGGSHGVKTSADEPIGSQTLRPWNVDNGLPTVTDQQANVKCADDNSQCSKALLTWKDLSPTHVKCTNGVPGDSETEPPVQESDQQKVVISWGQKHSPNQDDSSGSPNSVITWKQLSPTKQTRNAFGFSSPESSDSDTVRHYSPRGSRSAPPMQESSSDASVASPTHGVRSSGAGSDGSTYLPSPEDGFSNDYFYDEDFSVQFDTNLKDSLLETVPSEGVSTPSILEFSDTMTIDVNEASSTVDGSIRASQYESELSASEHNSVDMSTSEREMMCSSDMLQISDGPLFTPTPTNEMPSHISTDSLDKGARAMTGSASTSDTSKFQVDCGTKKELYMLSFFSHRGKQTTSLASVMSQGSWSSDQQGSRSQSNCTSQDDMEGSISASLQTHVDLGNHRSSTRHSGQSRTAPAPCRSHSENSGMNRRHMTSQATSTESIEGADKQGRLTSWRNVKQRRKLSANSSQDTATKEKSTSKSMPDLYMQNWLEKMSGCLEVTSSQDTGSDESAAEMLRGSATSLVEIYQKMRTDRLSDQNLGEGNMLSSEGKDSVFSDQGGAEDKPSTLPQRPMKLPPRFYTYSSESETSTDIRQRKFPGHMDQKFTGVQTSPQTSEPGGYKRGHTLPRTYKRSLSSPARCLHACPSAFSLSGTERETQCPAQFLADPVTPWQGTKNFSAQFPPNTRDCGIQTSSPDRQLLSDKQMQTSPDRPCEAFPCLKHPPSPESQKVPSPQPSPTRLSRSAQVRRPPDCEDGARRCALIRPHSIGPIGQEEERRFPTYDAVVPRCNLREKRGSSLSPSRRNTQSFYSHRSLPDLSFLTDRSPTSSPVHPVPTEPSSCPTSSSPSKPVFFTPRVGGVTNPCGGISPKVPQNFHPLPYYPNLQQHVCMHPGEVVEGLNIEVAPQRQARHSRASRSESGRKSGTGHAPQSASSSSGFSTSSTSSGIDPGYHDNRHSPPMADQFPAGCHVWDSRHKFIETDGGCVYYHSLPNHLPPSFICEEEKMDFYSCMCVKPSVQETKMYAYKYERFPETHQSYLPSKSRQSLPPEGPAQDGGQELILEEHSSSSGLGTTDDMYSVHENESSSSPENGSNPDRMSKNFCASGATEAACTVLASNGVVLRRGRNWHHADQGSSETDSQRGSSDNLSGGNSSGSGGEDRKPLKSCLRRRKLERRCRSMSLSDPFRLYEGYFTPGARVKTNHRHSYACDGHPLYVDCLYENLDSSQFADMMDWYRTTYMQDVHLPLTARQCACGGDAPDVMRPEKTPSGDLAKIASGSGTFGETQSSEANDDSMERKEKRKSVSFASEVSFHSPLPSPQCSPKRQQSTSPVAGKPSSASQGQTTPKQVPHPGPWAVDSSPKGVPVPSAPLHVHVASDEDSSIDAPPSEFAVLSPEGWERATTLTQMSRVWRRREVIYLSDICRAAEALVAHFSQSKGPFDKLRLGNSVDTPEVGHLVLSQLCPAIARIISDGLKPYMSGLHVFGRIQVTVWRVAEVSAELGPSTRAVHDLVKDVRNRSDLVSMRQKFEAFIFGLLNLRLLDFWMGYTRHKDKVVGKLYEADSILCLSHTSLQRAFDEMLVSLQPLAILPFQLDTSFVVAYHTNKLQGGTLSVTGQEESHVNNPDGHLVLKSSVKGEITSGGMEHSQLPASNKTSWSWLGGSYMSNTLPRAKSLVSNMAQQWSPKVSRLHNRAVRSLTMLSSGSSTSSVGPVAGSQDKLEQCLPGTKGELFVKSQSVDSSSSGSACAYTKPESSSERDLGSLQNLPQGNLTSDEDSQTESSHGMSRFATKLYHLAAGKIEGVVPVYRRDVTEYYFEGDSDNGGTPRVQTPGTESSCSSSDVHSPVQTWRDVRRTPVAGNQGVIPPPKPPRTLLAQHANKPTSASMNSLVSPSSASSMASSPSKSKNSFDLIRLFDKLLLPTGSKQQQQLQEKDCDVRPQKPKRWSWTPLGNGEALRDIDVVSDHYGTVSTFKSESPKPPSSRIPANPEIPKTVTEKVAEAKKSSNQITLADGPVLTLPPSAPPKPESPAGSLVGAVGCYSGIVESEKLTLSLTFDSCASSRFNEVDGNANIVRSMEKIPVHSCSGANSKCERSSSSSNRSASSAQSTNQQSTSSHVPQSSTTQMLRNTTEGSSSDSDQSKSSSSSDQSETSTPSGAASETTTEKFKMPEYRYVETRNEQLVADGENHMTYAAGEFLEVLAQLDSDWLFCASGKKEGLVKLSDVRPVSEGELFSNLHSDFYN